MKLWPEPPIKPIPEHPRLFLTKKHIDHLNENMQSEELRGVFQQMNEYADEPLQTKLEACESGNFSGLLELKIEARALMYVLGRRDAAHAKETVRYAREYLTTVMFPKNMFDVTRQMGHTMIMGAVVYDWCYDYMTDEDKAVFIKRFKEIAAMKEIGYPPANPNLSSVASHAGEFEVFRDMIGTGVAVYDEDPEMYNFAAGRFFAEMAEPRRFFNQSGNHPMGNTYGYYRYGCELWSVIIFDRMGYPDVLGENMSKISYKWLYERLPFGQRFRDGDDFEYSKNRHCSYPTNDIRELGMAANFYKDPYLRRQSIKALSLRNYQTEQFWQLLFFEPEAGLKETNDLPLARKTTYPLSSLVARTSWQTGLDAPTAMAHMKIQEKFIACHMHLDCGGFQLYYKGNLAVSTGNYEGQDGSSGSSHYANYYARTVAHNCITVTDPNEKQLYTHDYVVDFSNDGGQIRGMGSPFAVFFKEQVVDDNRAYEQGTYIGPNEYTPKFSYIKGDIAPGYGKKVKEYHRSMVFMDLFDKDYPAAFVVFDRVKSADKSFKKRWLLHSIEEPAVCGNVTTIMRTERGFNGKLVNTTLLPEAFEIEKVGGEGMEYSVNGVNFPNRDYVGSETDGGNWRIELSPAKENETDLFLNAMYMTDADGKLPVLEMKKVNSGGMLGVAVRDRLVMFSETAEVIRDGFSITVPDNGFETVSVMLADIASGVWSVNGEFFAEVKEDEGVLYFEGKPGEYKIAPAADAKPTEVSYPKAEKAPIGDFLVYQRGQFLNQPKPTKEIDSLPYVPVSFVEGCGAKYSCDGDKATITNDKGMQLVHKATLIDGDAYLCLSELEDFLSIATEYDSCAKVFKISAMNREVYETIKNETIYRPIDMFASSQNGNPQRNAADYDMTNRWEAEGEECWIMLDLGDERAVGKILLAPHSMMKFTVDLSNDRFNFRTVYSGQTRGADDKLEEHTFTPATGRYVRLSFRPENIDKLNSVTLLLAAK